MLFEFRDLDDGSALGFFFFFAKPLDSLAICLIGKPSINSWVEVIPSSVAKLSFPHFFWDLVSLWIVKYFSRNGPLGVFFQKLIRYKSKDSRDYCNCAIAFQNNVLLLLRAGAFEKKFVLESLHNSLDSSAETRSRNWDGSCLDKHPWLLSKEFMQSWSSISLGLMPEL